MGNLVTQHKHNNQPAHHEIRPLVFISAAEQSADEHAASLIRATLAMRPDVRFVGIAGPKMVNAGCESLFDMTQHSAMLLSAIGAVGKGLRMLSIADEFLRMNPVRAAVVIDSPTLHLPLAARAKAAGVHVLYYIAPQLWAWGSYRIYKLRHNVERLACILPFEEEYFRNQGVNATFVGHPLADKLFQESVAESTNEQLKRAGRPFIALLPGSRKHVVQEILPGQLEIAEIIRHAFPSAGFVVSVANAATAPIVHSLVVQSRVPIQVSESPLSELVRTADLCLVASGTTTLEVAMHARPMIVMYQTSRLFYHLLARWMIHTKYLSLPNILADREVVPEFMPYYTSTKPIADKAIGLLRDEATRTRMIAELAALTQPLLESPASQNTANLLLKMIDRQKH